MNSNATLETVYDPQSVETEIYALWEKSDAFVSKPADTPHERTFTMVIPPPNVTGALHLGHALNNTLQDILVRYHRMRGFNTLWQPGTDHAGIATQAVVERRILELEGESRHTLGREKLVRRIWEWKDEYEKRILKQLKLMGCSCDWTRLRFTLDKDMAKAVRTQFFHMFKDGLIFRGKRLVNWDTQLQTAVSDDEVYYDKVPGSFWHFRYPVIDPKPGEPEFVVIATTRPETMLGDTAVAVHPDPKRALAEQEKKLRSELNQASKKERSELHSKLEAIAVRRESHLPHLIQLRDMAGDGRKLTLPLMERVIPLIADDWANPLLGSGCVKITPAHDPNDYEVGQRHSSIGAINVLTPDGKVASVVELDGNVNPHSERYEGLTFITDARAKIVADMESRGLLVEIEDRELEKGHSDRSKILIETCLSDQWFVKTEDVESLTLGDGTGASGLAQAAMDAVTDGRIAVFPERYGKSYLDWLGEKRDWCISRQLWWGHRIGVWTAQFQQGLVGRWHRTQDIDRGCAELRTQLGEALGELWKSAGFQSNHVVVMYNEREPTKCFICTSREDADKHLVDVSQGIGIARHVGLDEEDSSKIQVIFSNDPRYEASEKIKGVLFTLTREEDVLDTWFSSALWPFSTLGWPERTAHLKQYYPGSVLCTSRDIITNWVARMVMFGLYAIGEVPFDHVYIHPKILDGRGETMSKSKGNGVDPLDIIAANGADALRYSMVDMCTETQDIRMPVEYICPYCEKMTDQTIAIKREEQARKSRGEKLDRKVQPADCHQVKCANTECGWEFATQWANDELKKELRVARETSEKFEIGRNFCNKLWNAARFAFMNLEGAPCNRLEIDQLAPEDRWILGRLSQTIRRFHEMLRAYQFSASIKELRVFFWESLCDWYIELTKPRMAAPATDPVGGSARQVLAFCFDQVLRLLHPTVPFITERLWRQLNDIVPNRGLPGVVELDTDTDLIVAAFPPVSGYAEFENESILSAFSGLQDATRGVRELRSSCSVPPKQMVNVTVVVPTARQRAFSAHAHVLKHMAGIGELDMVTEGKRPTNAGSVTIGGLRIFVHDISDDEAERQRTRKSLHGIEKQVAGKQSKLGNERFIANAKPEIIEAERGRLDDLLAQQAAFQEHLKELGN